MRSRGLGRERKGMMAAGERWLRNALTLHELSSENADNVSLLTDPGSPSRLYLILPQHAFLIWDDKTPKHIDHQWRKAQTKWSKKKRRKSSLKCPHPTLITVLCNPSLATFVFGHPSPFISMISSHFHQHFRLLVMKINTEQITWETLREGAGGGEQSKQTLSGRTAKGGLI